MKWSTGAAAAALVVAGLCSGVAQGDSVKVGLIASYTGAFATWGTQFQQAVEAYQALHGKTIKGPDGTTHEIQFVYRDTASQGPDKAKQLAEELILRERVKFLTGLELSPYAMVLGDLSQQAKIPVVIMNAGAAPIVRGSPYFVRVSFTAAQFSIPGA
jgi:branched-chain amino acid transport system substrate-binding protein